MRINKYLATYTGLSRRKADDAISAGRVKKNSDIAKPGDIIEPHDIIHLDDRRIIANKQQTVLIMLNKPEGYVCSKTGQGSKTIYELLPAIYHHLKPVGRLDKNSSGLLLLTNDGELLNNLVHPSKGHIKQYLVGLLTPLSYESEIKLISGVDIGDSRKSKLELKLLDTYRTNWLVTISEGRNRQIRRSFEAVNNKVVALHRTTFGAYKLSSLEKGDFATVSQ